MSCSRLRGVVNGVALVLLLGGVLLMKTTPASAGILDATWTAPTTNTDGSQLTDLASYRVYYGPSPSPCPGASFFSVASPTSSPTQNQSVSLRLTGLVTGALYYVAVSAVDTSGNQSACSLSATAVARSDFNVSPSGTVNFGSVPLGSSVDQTFTVSNTTGGTVSGSASVPPPFSIVSGSPFSLSGVGATQAVKVRFTPTTTTTVSATASFTGNGETVTRIVTGSAGGIGGGGNGVDKTRPSVAITSPTSGSAYTTGSASLTLQGTASDNVGVTQVTWTNSRGGSGTATGTTSWTASGIVLQPGSNVLTVTARDAAGNARTATLTATFDNTQTPTIPAPPVPIPPAGLVAAYSFDEGAGTFVADASGNNNSGTLKGSVAWTTEGRFGNALSFSGGTITVPAAPSLDLSTAMTLEAWVYPIAAPTTWSTVVMKEQPGEFVYALYAGSPSAQPYALINKGSSSATELGTFAPTTLPVNTWSHLASTYDGANVRLYVNGVLMGSQPASGSIATSSGALMLGGNNVWGEFLTGRIDEVRIYNRALSLAEIQADMNTAVGAKPATDTTPPTVVIASPVGGAIVSGVLPVTAVAADDVGVVGVQFLLDGAPVGQEQGASPFSISWNTTSVGNGWHTLSARARDAAGNTAVAANVTVNVTNVTPTIPAPPVPSPTPSAGLVAAYGFEEGGGSTVADASGNGNTGTLSGGVRWTTLGRFGNALVFDGSNLVSIPADRSLDLTSAMTLEAWVYPTVAPTNWSTVLMKEQPGEFVYTLYSGSPTSQPYALINTGSSAATEQATFASTTLPVNTWSHLAATYDGANVRLYVNGVLMGSQPAGGSIATSNGTLVLGGNDVWGEYFTGLIDEVRIYNRALSLTEIQADMNTAVAGQ